MNKLILKKFIIFIFSFFILFACGIENTSSSSYSSFYSSQNESSSVVKEYETDKLGFYKLNKEDYYVPLSSDNKSLINYAPVPEGILTSQNLKLFENGNEIPLYNVKTNTSQTWNGDAPNRIDNSVGIVSKNGPITLVLQTNFTIKHGVTIRPSNKEIIPLVDEEKRLITFTIKDAGQYTIEFRLNRTLHLFVDYLSIYDEIVKIWLCT